jgi:hypothetical protein
MPSERKHRCRAQGDKVQELQRPSSGWEVTAVVALGKAMARGGLGSGIRARLRKLVRSSSSRALSSASKSSRASRKGTIAAGGELSGFPFAAA